MRQVRSMLAEMQQGAGSESLDALCYHGLTEDQREAAVAAGHFVYQGKVRDLIRAKDELWIYHTDRLSAFDRYVGEVPFKGAILARMSRFWFEACGERFPNHYRSQPHPSVLKVAALEPIKAEVIVRGYLAGSMARAYQKGERDFCGESLPEGLEEFHALPRHMITPTTKAAAYEHDEDATPEELIAAGVVTREEWHVLSQMALELFKFGQETYARAGWILVDTKYEFGRDAEGRLRVIDEIHTPDSSRLWRKQSYDERLAKGLAPEMLDKENVRRYLMDRGFSGEGVVPEVPAAVLAELALTYLDVAESLTQTPLMVSDHPVPLPG